jgi:hypothetical protein
MEQASEDDAKDCKSFIASPWLPSGDATASSASPISCTLISWSHNKNTAYLCSIHLWELGSLSSGGSRIGELLCSTNDEMLLQV